MRLYRRSEGFCESVLLQRDVRAFLGCWLVVDVVVDMSQSENYCTVQKRETVILTAVEK